LLLKNLILWQHLLIKNFKNMARVVTIKPLQKEKWHGKKNADSFTQPISLSALYNPKTGKYDTGLSKKDKERLEKETGYDLSDSFDPNKPHPFWDSRAALLTLPNHSIILNPDLPLDYIKIAIAKASKHVANSLTDYENGLYPDATHVIYDENEEVASKAKKVALLKEAYKIANKLNKQSKIALILIISGQTAKRQSDEFIEVALHDIIENKTEEFLSYANKTKAELTTRAMILDAVNENILQMKKGSIYYMDELLGNTITEAVEYLNDPKNQNLKIIINEKLL